MEPLIIGGGSEQTGVLYLLGVLSIMLAGLVLITATRKVFVLLLLFGLVAVAIGSLSPGGRSDTEPIPISPVEQRPGRCVRTDAAVQERHAASIFFSTSAGSAPNARMTKINSTTSRRRSPVSIFDIKDCGTSSTSATCCCVTPAAFRSNIKMRRKAAYSLLNNDFTIATLRLSTAGRSFNNSTFGLSQNRILWVFAKRTGRRALVLRSLWKKGGVV